MYVRITLAVFAIVLGGPALSGVYGRPEHNCALQERITATRRNNGRIAVISSQRCRLSGIVMFILRGLHGRPHAPKQIKGIALGPVESLNISSLYELDWRLARCSPEFRPCSCLHSQTGARAFFRLMVLGR